MRRRFKILIGFAVVCLILAALGSAVLLALPWIPTGFDKIEKQYRADLAAQAAPQATPTPNPAQPNPALLAPTASAPVTRVPTESPRQRFLRCWKWLNIGGLQLWQRDHASICDKLGSMLSESWNALQPFNSSFGLTPPQWEAISRLGRGTPEYEAALRRFIVEKVGDYYHPPQNGDLGIVYPRDVAALIQAEPLAQADEILRLPDGAIPALPESPLIDNSSFFPALIQAYLRAAIKDPAFDAAAGLRRLNEWERYLALARFPASDYYFARSVSALLAVILARSEAAPAPVLRAIAGELSIHEAGEQQWRKENQEKINRYYAVAARRVLNAECEAFYTGSATRDNTFHYFLGGRPERVWMRLSRGAVQRQIDLYATALASGGDESTLNRERDALTRVLRLANIALTRQIPEESDRGNEPRQATMLAMELALRAWWKDRGRLPENLDELKPDYLPQEFKPAENTFWWFETVKGRTLIVRAVLVPTAIPEEFRDSIQDPQRFKAAVLKDWPAKQPTPTAEQIEQGRQEMLKQKNHGATLSVQAKEVALGNQ